MGSDLQEAMHVQGKGEVEARGLESMSRVLPPHLGILALTKRWPCLKAGDWVQERASGCSCRGRPGHLSWASLVYVFCHKRPCEWPHCFKLLKMKFAVEFPLRRKQKQRKQNLSPEGTLVLLSASRKSGGLGGGMLPTTLLTWPFVTGSAESRRGAPTQGPVGL